MIIDGKKVSLEIKENLIKEVMLLKKFPTLVVLQIGDNESSNIYIRQKEKIAKEIGINFMHEKFDKSESESKIADKIKHYNQDKKVNGIIIQLPIPDKYDTNFLINLISPDKDVDGLTDINMIKLIKNTSSFIPCTPLGIMELLKYYNISVSGKNVVIVGRSNLVGKPLSNLMLAMNGTVTLCHSKTKNISLYTKNADILVSAAGCTHLIKKDMVKKDCVVIDVGINRENGKIMGDTDYDDLKDNVGYITPVPGGVGPMTVIMLMKNCINSYKKTIQL